MDHILRCRLLIFIYIQSGTLKIWKIIAEAINVTNLVKLTELDLSGNPGANFQFQQNI